MFHLKNLINTLGLCLCAVLLLVPAASQAMPAGDEHFALPYDETAVLPGDGEVIEAAVDGTVAPAAVQCVADCHRNCRACVDGCKRDGAGNWCKAGCYLDHAMCIFNCRNTF